MRPPDFCAKKLKIAKIKFTINKNDENYTVVMCLLFIYMLFIVNTIVNLIFTIFNFLAQKSGGCIVLKLAIMDF